MDDYNNMNAVDGIQTKWKRIIGLAFLFIMVVGFAIATISYCIDTKKDKSKIINAGSDDAQSENREIEFINKLNDNNPEFKLERVSYSAYRIAVSQNVGEAIINVVKRVSYDSDTENKDDKYRFSVTIHYEYISNEVQFENNNSSLISDYIDAKQTAIIKQKAEDIAVSVKKIIECMGDYNFTDENQEKLIQILIKVNKDGGKHLLTADGLIITAEDKSSDETIDIRITEE